MHAQEMEIDHNPIKEIAIMALLELSGQDLSSALPFEIPIVQRMLRMMDERKTLTFLLPAFPAKSPSTLKTHGTLPDLGEVLALNNLNEMCRKISLHYGPGAEVVICSDGRVFSDVVFVDDETIDQYSEGIKNIIKEFHLEHLSTFAMDDLYQDLTADQLRERLVWQFAKSTDEIRHLVVNDDNYRGLFNGVHRFLVEDQLGLPSNRNKSKNQVQKAAKQLSYELLKRSDAWSVLLENYFGESLRLSIHAYPLKHEKFGVKLVSSSDKWATPWHNVTVKKKDAFELMHFEKAIALGAEKKEFRGKYVYFELE